MPLVDLDTLKKHLRVLHDDEDAEIMLYGAAAEAVVIEHLDRIVVGADVVLPVEGDPGYDPDAFNATPTIVAAILLVAGDLYEVREPDPKLIGDAVLPRAVRMLLAPWRIWRPFKEDAT
ncbi:head-tail connector protein [Endobacterium cereale]|uniref:head-tail connector protein n=1 Tax=Endobacterium cereale TaxID=2663029 RepID=UPI002B47453F|nr:head-tail connector protein [Endobacterium cereale]MEB2845923.1 head-tail connector protein [Endobacterium cereale]